MADSIATIFFAIVLSFTTACFGIAGFIASKDEEVANYLEVKMENYVTLASTTLYTERRIDYGKPTLIFLHGWGAQAQSMLGKGKAKVVETLSQSFSVIAPELPGLVRSAPPNRVWSFEEYADAIHELVLSTSTIRTPFILMGQSFGGGVATVYANKYPNDLSHLILVDATQGNRPRNAYYRSRFLFNPFFKRIVESRFVPLTIKKIFINGYLGVPWQMMTKESASSYATMGDIQSASRVDVDYAKITTQTLLLWGKKDTIGTPISRAKEIAEEMPNATFVEIEGGHLALYTHMDEAIHVILDFLKKN